MSDSSVYYTRHTALYWIGKHLCSVARGVVLNPTLVAGCPTYPCRMVSFRELYADRTFFALHWLPQFQLVLPDPCSPRQAPRRVLSTPEIRCARCPPTSSLRSAFLSRFRRSFLFMLQQDVSTVFISLLSLAHFLPPDGTCKVSNGAFGANYGIHILCVISLLLLTREAFFAATAGNPAKQNDEDWWYPFAVLTEFAAVVMFATPGLVPSRYELPS